MGRVFVHKPAGLELDCSKKFSFYEQNYCFKSWLSSKSFSVFCHFTFECMLDIHIFEEYKKRSCIMNFHYRYSLELILPGRLFLHYRLSLVLGGKTNTCFFFLYNYRKVYHDTHNALLLYASLYMREEKRKIAIWSIFSKSITV